MPLQSDSSPTPPPVFSTDRSPRRIAASITLIYLLIGMLWILLSDLVVETVIGSELNRSLHLQTFKGWLFVITCGAVLYVLIYRSAAQIVREHAARRSADARFRELFETAEEGVWLTDAEARTTMVNPKLASLLGYSPEAMVGRLIFEFMDEKSAAIARLNIERRRAGLRERYEFRLRHRDGSDVWTLISSCPVLDARGRYTGAIDMLTDITDEKRQRLAMENLVAGTAGVTGQAFFPELVRHLAAALDVRYAKVGELSPDGKTVCVLASWSVDHLDPPHQYDPTGAPCRLVLDENRRCYVPSGLAAEFPEDEMVRRLHAESYIGVPLSDSSGRTIGHLCALDDRPMPATPDQRTEAIFTIFAARAAAELERQRAADALQKLNEGLEARVRERTSELRQANEQLGAFTYAVSHDLRIPLRSMRDFATRLLETPGEDSDSARREWARRIVGAAHRTDTLIADLLEFSRLPHQQAQLRLEPVSLVLLVHEVVGRLGRDPEFEHATFNIREPLPWARAHRPSMALALTNVLAAAVRLVPEELEPVITIWSTPEDGHRRRLFIANNAPGPLSDALQQLLLEDAGDEAIGPAHPARAGLALARRSVQRIGGDIGCASVSGYGNVFWLDLASAEAPA